MSVTEKAPWQSWEFYNPVHLVVGGGVLKRLPALLGAGKILLVTTPGFSKRGMTRVLAELLDGWEVAILDNVQPNPTIDKLEEVSKSLGKKDIKQIVALGGGSAIDSAKVLSFMLGVDVPDFSLRDHFEAQCPLPDTTPLPLLAIPTTAGTGSEVTPFATVWELPAEKKYSLASPHIFAKTALLDPELTLTLPRDLTIITGLDALSHALESIWNRNANPVTRAYALRAAAIILETLPLLVSVLDNPRYRARMMEASLLAGLAISSTRTALAHSISYPITMRYGMPHGLACSFTLPAILEYNAGADDGRLLETIQALGFNSGADFRESLLEMYRKMGVRNLVERYVKNTDELLLLAPQMFTPGRADNNLRGVNAEQLCAILQRTLEWC